MKADSRPPRSLAAMRLAAGSLLIAMSALYVAAVLNTGAAWGYAKAFAEAAMVGGLADWFAVTALFRRPLGLPIPHTAIIPRSKARIATALGDFVAVNFLAPDVVRERLGQQDLAGTLARQISDPQTARRIADGLFDALPGLVDLLDDDAVSDFLHRQMSELSRGGRLPSAIGSGLRLLTDQGRHQPVLDAALSEAWHALAENEPVIRASVSARTNWFLRLVSVDASTSNAMIGAIEDSLRAMAHNPDHPARQRVTALLQRFSDDLQKSPALQAQVEQVLAEALAHPAIGTWLDAIWESLKSAVRDSAADSNSEARQGLADTVAHFGESLSTDPAAQEAINSRLRVLLAELAGRHGSDIARLISDTIQGWDSRTVVEKLEQNVGPDLQFIRINGTLIGGLVGLGLYGISRIFF